VGQVVHGDGIWLVATDSDTGNPMVFRSFALSEYTESVVNSERVAGLISPALDRFTAAIRVRLEVAEKIMPEVPFDQRQEKNDPVPLPSLAEELKRESEHLRRLAEQLQAREAAQAEMVADYPHLKRALYALLREVWDRELPPLPDEDLETLALREGAVPLEAFIAEVEQPGEGP
jgi:hypothetical protein